jgi:hypothetical protein
VGVTAILYAARDVDQHMRRRFQQVAQFLQSRSAAATDCRKCLRPRVFIFGTQLRYSLSQEFLHYKEKG